MATPRWVGVAQDHWPADRSTSADAAPASAAVGLTAPADGKDPLDNALTPNEEELACRVRMLAATLA